MAQVTEPSRRPEGTLSSTASSSLEAAFNNDRSTSEGSNNLASTQPIQKFNRESKKPSQRSDAPLIEHNQNDYFHSDPTPKSSLLLRRRRSKSQMLHDNQSRQPADIKHQYVATRTTTATSGDCSYTTTKSQEDAKESNCDEFYSWEKRDDQFGKCSNDTLQQYLCASFTSVGPPPSVTDTVNTASPLIVIQEISCQKKSLKQQPRLSFPSTDSNREDNNNNNNTNRSQESTPSIVNESLPDKKQRNRFVVDSQSSLSNHSQLSDDGMDNPRSAIHRKILLTDCDEPTSFVLSSSKCRSLSVDHSTASKFVRNSSIFHNARSQDSNSSNEFDSRYRLPSDSPFYLKQRLVARQKQLQQQNRLTDGTSQHSSFANDPSPCTASIANSDSKTQSNRDSRDEKNSFPYSPINGNKSQNDHRLLMSGAECSSISSAVVLRNEGNRDEVKQLQFEKTRVESEEESKGCPKRTNLSGAIGSHPRASKTKSQLAGLQEKIVKFEELLQLESEHRKAAGEGKLNVLKEALGALDKTLAAEVRRRMDANKTIHIGFEQQLAALDEKIDQTLEERSKEMSLAVEALVEKLKLAETGAREAVEVQAQKLKELANDIEVVAAESHKTKDYITSEFQARRQRSEIISDKLMELEKQIENRVSIEKSVRERDVRKLEGSVEELKEQHIALDDVFQHELAAKFLELKNALRDETQAREQADDDIVQALNYYTTALQSALRIANSA